tara:strand:+ start:4602 stop:5768 length:1167 start_codon:yes stop_codon:yes gene_type:complete
MSTFSENIIIFGGGRWTRVIIKVLSDIIKNDCYIYIHTNNCNDLMKDWIINENLSHKVFLIKNLNTIYSKNIKTAIISNSPKDHFKRATWALKKNLNVLIEKPLCINEKEFVYLKKISITSKGKLCAAHVFNYLSSLNTYKNLIPDINKISKINITWIDPVVEKRYGEIKNTIPKISIYLDVLPHIFSIIKTIWSTSPKTLSKVKLTKGSSLLCFETRIKGTKTKIKIERLGKERKRVIEAFSEEDSFKLDFTNEPGFFKSKENTIVMEKYGEKNIRPLTQLLNSFLRYSKENIWDERLSTNLVLPFLKFSEKLDKYHTRNINNLFNMIKNKDYILSKNDFYLINEFLQKSNDIDIKEVNKIIENLIEYLRNNDYTQIEIDSIDLLNL